MISFYDIKSFFLFEKIIYNNFFKLSYIIGNKMFGENYSGVEGELSILMYLEKIFL